MPKASMEVKQTNFDRTFNMTFFDVALVNNRFRPFVGKLEWEVFQRVTEEDEWEPSTVSSLQEVDVNFETEETLKLSIRVRSYGEDKIVVTLWAKRLFILLTTDTSEEIMVDKAFVPPEDGNGNDIDNGNDITCTKPAKPTMTGWKEDEYNHIEWNEPSDTGGCDIERYNIQREKMSAFSTYTVLTTVGGSVLHYDDAAVEDGYVYRYRISASNETQDGYYGKDVFIDRR